MSEFPEIPDKFKHLQRKDVPNINDILMGKAILWSMMSKDPSTQVGASIYSKENRELSSGYNGTPEGWPDDDFPWGKGYTGEDKQFEKYAFVVHAEANAIRNFFKYNNNGAVLDGTTIYVTLFPCSNCAKLIVENGIKKVVYLSDKYNYSADNLLSKQYLKENGVEFEQFQSNDIEFIKLYMNAEDEPKIKWKGKQRTRRK